MRKGTVDCDDTVNHNLRGYRLHSSSTSSTFMLSQAMPQPIQDYTESNIHDHISRLNNPKLKRIMKQHIFNEEHKKMSSSEYHNVEEILIYCFIFLLVLIFFTQFIKCIRITLDPYNTASSGAWLETLENTKPDPMREVALNCERKKRSINSRAASA